MAERLNFEIDTELAESLITSRAGIPSLIEAFRLSGTAAVVDRTVKVKTRKRGPAASEMVESLLAMWAAGGERAEDLDQFRQDKALVELIGHELPAAQTARDYLDRFHEDDLPLLQEGLASVPSYRRAELKTRGAVRLGRGRERGPARAPCRKSRPAQRVETFARAYQRARPCKDWRPPTRS